MIIDFHTHMFPDAIAAAALRQLEQNARDISGEQAGIHPHTDGTANGLAESANRAGIDVCVVMPIATSVKPSETLNTFAAAIDARPGLRSFGSVHPRCPRWQEELERVRALGLRGIKLHPEYQDFFVDSPEGQAVVREAARLGLWVLFHAGEDVGIAPPVHCTPERVARLRQAVPEAKLILAHMGGYRLWKQVLPLLPALGAWLDTSFCIPNHPEAHELLARVLRENGPEHVLFGTDSPWADQQVSLQATRQFLTDYGFSAEETAAILGGNTQRLLAGQV